ncbi:MAG: hypothetical protein LBU06_08330 [Desulfovibrio sp.]|jgi:hypothetical protein|nr:hypothetical protein [Desulfovibrio sp.]
MSTTLSDMPVKQLRYAPINERYYESVAANIMIRNAMGPLHPGASFTLSGYVFLQYEHRLEISATALTQITEFARRVTFQVTASVMKNGVFVCPTQTLKRHHDAYLHSFGSIVIGETSFILPEPIDLHPLTVTLEGTYFAEFDEGGAMPRSFFGVGPAYVRKNFIIKVVEETL